MTELNFMQAVAVWALPVLFAITVHEVAHGWMAKQLGDPTAMMLGRLTLNPIKHVDPTGTILVPAVLLFSQVVIMNVASPILFGWAKPVPVTWENLRNPRVGMALVAVAGPASNLIQAVLWAVVLKIAFNLPATLGWLALPLIYMGAAGILINLVLMLLNLVPIPPLDGGRVAVGLLPPKLGYQLARLEPYGLVIVIVLLFTGVLFTLLQAPLSGLHQLLYNFARS